MSEYKLVNWTGTMNISDDQFRQTENFFLAAIADADSKYGLYVMPAGDINTSDYQTERHTTIQRADILEIIVIAVFQHLQTIEVAWAQIV